MQRSLFLAFAVFVFIFLVGLVGKVEAAQVMPIPGYNCGVGYPDKRPNQDPNAVPDLNKVENGLKVNEYYACCASPYFENLDSIQPIPQELQELSLIGPVIEAVNDILDPLNFPNNFLFFLPDNTFPSVRTVLQGVFSDNQPCLTGQPIGDPKSNSCYCKEGIAPALKAIITLCNNIGSANERNECQKCMGYDPKTNNYSEGGLWTGFGCVQTSLSSFIQEVVFRVGIGFAGLVSLGCIIFSAFLLQTSRGDAEGIQAARDMIQSCLIGLLMIIFSIFILRLIGIDILRIPGFS